MLPQYDVKHAARSNADEQDAREGVPAATMPTIEEAERERKMDKGEKHKAVKRDHNDSKRQDLTRLMRDSRT